METGGASFLGPDETSSYDPMTAPLRDAARAFSGGVYSLVDTHKAVDAFRHKRDKPEYIVGPLQREANEERERREKLVTLWPKGVWRSPDQDPDHTIPIAITAPVRARDPPLHADIIPVGSGPDAGSCVFDVLREFYSIQSLTARKNDRRTIFELDGKTEGAATIALLREDCRERHIRMRIFDAVTSKLIASYHPSEDGHEVTKKYGCNGLNAVVARGHMQLCDTGSSSSIAQSWPWDPVAKKYVPTTDPRERPYASPDYPLPVRATTGGSVARVHMVSSVEEIFENLARWSFCATVMPEFFKKLAQRFKRKTLHWQTWRKKVRDETGEEPTPQDCLVRRLALKWRQKLYTPTPQPVPPIPQRCAYYKPPCILRAAFQA